MATRVASNSPLAIPLLRTRTLEGVASLVESLGVPFETALRRGGLPNLPLDRQDGFLPFRDALAVVEAAARQTGVEHLGLRVSNAAGLDALGQHRGFVAAAASLLDGIDRAGRFATWNTLGAHLSLSREGSNLVWQFHLTPEIRENRRHAGLYALATMRDVVRLAVGRNWTPGELRVEGRPAQDRQEVVESFGERIVWQASMNALVFPETLLAHGFMASRPGRPIDDESAAGGPPAALAPDFIGSVRLLTRSLLPAGYPSVELLARLSGLSLRSFQRQLAVAGRTFSGLVEQTRHEQAIALMRDPSIRLTEVALELGYSDPANFTRAFRRWTGLAPQRYRQAAP